MGLNLDRTAPEASGYIFRDADSGIFAVVYAVPTDSRYVSIKIGPAYSRVFYDDFYMGAVCFSAREIGEASIEVDGKDIEFKKDRVLPKALREEIQNHVGWRRDRAGKSRDAGVLGFA